MEESISLLSRIKEEFGLQKVDLKTYSPLTLAFLGDCVYEIVIRTILVGKGNCTVNSLHKRKSQLVKAETQSVMAEFLLQYMTETEEAVYKRGRNATSHSVAKNASVADYRKATGLEAVFGYLYLADDMDRAMQLMKMGIEALEIDA